MIIKNGRKEGETIRLEKIIENHKTFIFKDMFVA